jgi:hypothetical protein
MSIEQTLYDTLRNDGTVAGLVSTRIYPSVAPDNAAVPYLTYQVISTEAHNKLVGSPDTERKSIQVNCISNSYTESKSISAACKSAINGTVGYLDNDDDDYFAQTQNYRVRLDFALIG